MATVVELKCKLAYRCTCFYVYYVYVYTLASIAHIIYISPSTTPRCGRRTTLYPAQPRDLYSVVSLASPGPSTHRQNTMFGTGTPRNRLGIRAQICRSVQWKTRWKSGQASCPSMTIPRSSGSFLVSTVDAICWPAAAILELRFVLPNVLANQLHKLQFAILTAHDSFSQKIA